MTLIFTELNIYNTPYMIRKNGLIKFLLVVGFIIYLFLTLIMPDAKYLGKGYVYLEETKIIYNKRKPGCGIMPYVLDYKFNSKHIIVMQKRPQIPNVIYNQLEYPNRLDSVFFYVIEKSTNAMYGPCDSMMFNDCIRKLQVDLTF